jgi:CubicO group peptidase (beta-lactamase class C family)
MTNLSTSKTITATAVMKAMEDLNIQGKSISIDSQIAPYLPSDWTLGLHVNEMTFKDLLTHMSGLRPATNDPDTYDGLRQTIANGTTNFRKFKYVNGNFCLFRLGELHSGSPDLSPLSPPEQPYKSLCGLSLASKINTL